MIGNVTQGARSTATPGLSCEAALRQSWRDQAAFRLGTFLLIASTAPHRIESFTFGGRTNRAATIGCRAHHTGSGRTTMTGFHIILAIIGVTLDIACVVACLYRYVQT